MNINRDKRTINMWWMFSGKTYEDIPQEASEILVAFDYKMVDEKTLLFLNERFIMSRDEVVCYLPDKKGVDEYAYIVVALNRFVKGSDDKRAYIEIGGELFNIPMNMVVGYTTER